MTPLDRAVFICGTQSELARRATGRAGTGHVYHWRKNGLSEDVAIAVERAVADAIAELPEAAARAAEVGGAVTAEQLRPDREWERDESGRIVGYRVAVQPSAEAA